MATQTYDTAVRAGRANNWQDWANLVLAIWLFISPWVLAFGTGGANAGVGGSATAAGDAAWNAWVLGVIVFLVALSAIGRMELWQEWINLLLGIWIFIAPWVLGFAGLANAGWDHRIVGALVAAISVCILAQVGQGRRVPAEPPRTL